MAKIRSKLKRNVKGKTWSKGHSSTSNPEQMKHRQKAQSRFFQANLSLVPSDNSTSTLTAKALQKHDQRQAYNVNATVNEVAANLDSCSLNDDDEAMSGSQQTSFKTFNSFASNYSLCSNASFKKLLNGFRASSSLHKEMLAILTALTELIKERGGNGTSTEYFLLLMEQIEASKEDSDIIAGISLLSMGIKSVPAAVLRKRFSNTAQTLMCCLERLMESDNSSVVRYIIACLSVLLRAQDYQTWSYSSTWKYIDALLSFTIHSKPKIRKAAQHGIVSIIHGSSFMLPSKQNATQEEIEKPDVEVQDNSQKIKYHPVSNRVVNFCLQQFKPEVLAHSQTTLLHTITLLKDTLGGFKTEEIRAVCEQLLSIMTAANVLVRTNCFQAFHALFISRTDNLNALLSAKLLAAIYEYRPDRADVRQTLAWLTVLKEGHMHLAKLDLTMCVNALPRLFEICVIDLWMSERTEVIVGVANCLKEILLDCIKPACENEQLANMHRMPVSRCIALMHKMLSAPFGDVAKYVILSYAVVFEVCGKFFGSELAPSLSCLASRYDTQSTLRLQIEHALIAAIKTLGPEMVLKIITLTNSKGEVVLEKSWLLPLLREGCSGASFKFFKETILPLALDCNTKWQLYTEKKQVSMSHTYELLCCQLWGLFPGFCRQPKDPQNFSSIAPTLGNALDNNPEFRAPIFDGIIILLEQDNTVISETLGKYAKNFLPRLFNIYMQKPNGTYEADLRNKCLEVIKLYLCKTPDAMLKELLIPAQQQLKTTTVGSFEYEAIFDITAALLVLQTSEIIREFFEAFIVPVLKKDKSKIVCKDEQKLKRQQRKTYELLCNILTSEAASCQKFMRKNVVALQTLMLDAFPTSCSVCQAARLKCLNILIANRKKLTPNDKIVISTIPEAILQYKEFSTRKENVSEQLIKQIAQMYEDANLLNDFVDILVAGFAGDETLISNTILAFRNVVQHQGANMTIVTLEFILGQICVFLVQKSRAHAEAAVIFLITFIKVLPTPLVANNLENIMRSLSAMVKDTKRYCRIQIGYLLKKLCKRFTAEEVIKFVPGDDELTHRRLKKIRKQMRRENRKKVNEQKGEQDSDDDEEEFITGLEKKSVTIEDILADSDSDLPDDMDSDNQMETNKSKSKSKKNANTYIREAPEEVVDLADVKSIANILTNRPEDSKNNQGNAQKLKNINRGFKTTEDGRLIISDKALRGVDSDDSNMSDNDETMAEGTTESNKRVKRGMEDDSSDDEEIVAKNRKRKSTDTFSMRSGKTGTSHYTTGGKGIHRNLATDAVSMKSGYSAKSAKSTTHAATAYAAKKAKGDMKKKGKLDPYAYLPLNRNTLNKRKRAKITGTFKNIVNGARKGSLKGVQSRMKKTYKK